MAGFFLSVHRCWKAFLVKKQNTHIPDFSKKSGMWQRLYIGSGGASLCMEKLCTNGGFLWANIFDPKTRQLFIRQTKSLFMIELIQDVLATRVCELKLHPHDYWPAF